MYFFKASKTKIHIPAVLISPGDGYRGLAMDREGGIWPNGMFQREFLLLF